MNQRSNRQLLRWRVVLLGLLALGHCGVLPGWGQEVEAGRSAGLSLDRNGTRQAFEVLRQFRETRVFQLLTEDEKRALDRLLADEDALTVHETPPVHPGAAPVMALVSVKAGRFTMGVAVGGEDDEAPQREVQLSQGFWIGQREVTQAEYEAVMGHNPSRFQGGTLPVDSVSWHDAQRFCELLTGLERAGGRLPEGFVYRLPTEAEWEYAARGGGEVAEPVLAAEREALRDAQFWYILNSGGRTHRVGSRSAGLLQLHDMLGNVQEWCHDWYQSSYHQLATVDPSGPSSGSHRVFRGGSWASGPFACRPTYRGRMAPSNAGDNVGFRVVLARPLGVVGGAGTVQGTDDTQSPGNAP